MFVRTTVKRWIVTPLLVLTALAQAGEKRPQSAQGSEPAATLSPSITPRATQPTLAEGSFVLEASSEYADGDLWVEYERLLSTYTSGVLTRQAIVKPANTLPVPLVGMRYFSYDALGRLREERGRDMTTVYYFGPTTYDQTITYTYNDSGRVTQSVRTREFTGGYQEVLRTSYSYWNSVTIESVLHERLDEGVWNPYQRDVYYVDASGDPDSIASEGWSGQTWVAFRMEVFFRPARDSLVATTRSLVNDVWQNSSRTASRYDQEGQLTYQANEYFDMGSWRPQNQTSFTYDRDGVLLTRITSNWTGSMWIPADRYKARRTPAPAILLVTPAGGERYFGADTVLVRFLGTGDNLVALEYTTDDGASWTRFMSGLPDTGAAAYRWTPGAGLGTTRLRAVAGPAVAEMQTPLTILPGRENLTHETSTVRCDVFSTGYLGGYALGRPFWAQSVRRGLGFRYRGMPDALFSGGVIVGDAGPSMGGMLSSFFIATFDPALPFSEFTRNGSFDQRSQCTIVQNDRKAGFLVTQTTSSRTQDDFVIISYEVRSDTDKELKDFHVGIFADWDIGNLYSNRGGIDSLRGLAYQYDPTGTDSNYYGVVALSGMSGAAVTDAYPDMSFVRSINPVRDNVEQYDLRTFIGSGPFALGPDDIARAAFALVAGTTLAGLQAHADSARALWGDRTVSVDTHDELPWHSALEQNYPNPFNPSSDIRFEIADAGEVRLVVYDLLGREVAVLVNERRTAGSYQVRFDASGLSSGVYLYRLTAGSFAQTRRMILVK